MTTEPLTDLLTWTLRIDSRLHALAADLIAERDAAIARAEAADRRATAERDTAEAIAAWLSTGSWSSFRDHGPQVLHDDNLGCRIATAIRAGAWRKP